MDPDAIEGRERPPGWPGAYRGRSPKVGAEMPEGACQEKPFIDVPKDHGVTVGIFDNGLGETLHLESPLPWSQA